MTYNVVLVPPAVDAGLAASIYVSSALTKLACGGTVAVGSIAVGEAVAVTGIAVGEAVNVGWIAVGEAVNVGGIAVGEAVNVGGIAVGEAVNVGGTRVGEAVAVGNILVGEAVMVGETRVGVGDAAIGEDARAGIGDVFKLAYWFEAYLEELIAFFQAVVTAAELWMGYVRPWLISQFIHTTALIFGKLFGICVVSASVIQAAFLVPPSPASIDATSASIIGLFGASVSMML